jgi:hypothetical protein
MTWSSQTEPCPSEQCRTARLLISRGILEMVGERVANKGRSRLQLEL